MRKYVPHLASAERNIRLISHISQENYFMWAAHCLLKTIRTKAGRKPVSPGSLALHHTMLVMQKFGNKNVFIIQNWLLIFEIKVHISPNMNIKRAFFKLYMSDSHPAFFLPIATTSNKKSVTTLNEKCRCCEFGDKRQ